MRTVSVLLKKNDLDLAQFAASIRLKNKLNDLNLTETLADLFLENMAMHCFMKEIDPKEFLTQMDSVCSIAKYLNIPILQLPDYLEEKIKENKDQIE